MNRNATSIPKVSKNTLLRIFRHRSLRQLGKDGLEELTSYVNDYVGRLIDELEPALDECNELLKYQKWQRISGTVVKRAIARLEGDDNV